MDARVSVRDRVSQWVRLKEERRPRSEDRGAKTEERRPRSEDRGREDEWGSSVMSGERRQARGGVPVTLAFTAECRSRDAGRAEVRDVLDVLGEESRAPARARFARGARRKGQVA